MNNETLIAVLVTVVVLGVGIAAWLTIRSALLSRQEIRARQYEVMREIVDSLAIVRSAMSEVGKSVGSAIQTQNENVASWLKTLNEQMQENTKAAKVALDPEVSKKFTAAVDHLTGVLEKHAADIERFGDSGALMASSCRKLNDNITALRAIVYGGKRADDFAFTSEDPEGMRRAEIESEVMDLMRDHNMPRPEAERRVKNLYATKPL